MKGVDIQVGGIRDRLRGLDLEQDTMIILMGDNGYFLNERQLAEKWLLYENSLRVP
jgi:arylsulfatase A-like enzyme